VELTVTQNKHWIEFNITNYCPDAELQIRRPLFKAGFSTKLEGHQGLGLSIVKSIADRYKGEVSVQAPGHDKLMFNVRIPL